MFMGLFLGFISWVDLWFGLVSCFPGFDGDKISQRPNSARW